MSGEIHQNWIKCKFLLTLAGMFAQREQDCFFESSCNDRPARTNVHFLQPDLIFTSPSREQILSKSLSWMSENILRCLLKIALCIELRFGLYIFCWNWAKLGKCASEMYWCINLHITVQGLIKEQHSWKQSVTPLNVTMNQPVWWIKLDKFSIAKKKFYCLNCLFVTAYIVISGIEIIIKMMIITSSFDVIPKRSLTIMFSEIIYITCTNIYNKQ